MSQPGVLICRAHTDMARKRYALPRSVIKGSLLRDFEKLEVRHIVENLAVGTLLKRSRPYVSGLGEASTSEQVFRPM